MGPGGYSSREPTLRWVQLLLIKVPTSRQPTKPDIRPCICGVAPRAEGAGDSPVLLDHGADITKRDNLGRTPFSVRCTVADIELIKLFLAMAQTFIYPTARLVAPIYYDHGARMATPKPSETSRRRRRFCWMLVCGWTLHQRHSRRSRLLFGPSGATIAISFNSSPAKTPILLPYFMGSMDCKYGDVRISFWNLVQTESDTYDARTPLHIACKRPRRA